MDEEERSEDDRDVEEFRDPLTVEEWIELMNSEDRLHNYADENMDS